MDKREFANRALMLFLVLDQISREESLELFNDDVDAIKAFCDGCQEIVEEVYADGCIMADFLKEEIAGLQTELENRK